MKGLLFGAVVTVLLVWNAGAESKTFVVGPDGQGDFTTIQAAIDAANESIPTDTVIVSAGFYDERIMLSRTFNPDLLVCPSGAESTGVLGIAEGGSWGGGWAMRGLTVKERCLIADPRHLSWERCAFLGGFVENRGGGSPDLFDCDFYGPTTLDSYDDTLRSLRFHHAPLEMGVYGGGDLVMEDCTFEGDGSDTLVSVINGTEGVCWRNCRFSNARIGVNALSHGANSYERCRFEDLGTAICAQNMSAGTSTMGLDSCTADRCGRVVWARFVGEAATYPSYFGMHHTVVRSCTGTAIDVTQADPEHGCTQLRVNGNRFEGGAALVLKAVTAQAVITGNAFLSNGSTALDLTLTSSAYLDSVAGNTFALNLGDGLRVHGGAGGLPPGLAIVRNIAAQNGGDGIHVDADWDGTLADNDSWQNEGVDFVGVAKDTSNNFSLDPKFCDLQNGVLTVSAGSPCRPSPALPLGIGAYGVGCDTELLDAPPLADAVALTARPNPARGVVTFALPGRASTGTLEVLDVQGRRVWRAPIEAGASAVQWRGEREGGARAGAGIYWVRLNRGDASTQTKRFIWLE